MTPSIVDNQPLMLELVLVTLALHHKELAPFDDSESIIAKVRSSHNENNNPLFLTDENKVAIRHNCETLTLPIDVDTLEAVVPELSPFTVLGFYDDEPQSFAFHVNAHNAVEAQFHAATLAANENAKILCTINGHLSDANGDLAFAGTSGIFADYYLREPLAWLGNGL